MEKIIELLEKFTEERNWRKYHTPKNLAISMAIEAAELLEHFQWENPSFDEVKNKEEVADEVADIMIYAILFMNYMGKHVEDVIMKKIKKNAKKYPA